METSAESIFQYFTELTPLQQKQFTQLWALYQEWNAKINVISRKDIDNLYLHHVLHSLGIAKVIRFEAGAHILDLGTGGGFPGIPLAILFPEVQFTLIDSIGKKIKVANAVIEGCGLKNVKALHLNAKALKKQYDFVVSRAVMKLSGLLPLVQKHISKTSRHSLKNGLICLKGENVDEEIFEINKPCQTWHLSDFFAEPFFETKKMVHVTL